MKVLIVNEKYPPHIGGGAERSVQILAEGLLSIGASPIVATLVARRADAGRERLNGVPIRRVPLANLHWPFDGKPRHPVRIRAFQFLDLVNAVMARRLERIVATEKPDIIHTNNICGFGVPALSVAGRSGVPVVHTLRDYYLLCPFSTMFRSGKPCTGPCSGCKPFLRVARRASRAVASVVGNSRFILERHRAFGFFAAAPGKVIYNVAGHGSAAPRRRDEVRPPVTFGFLGRIVPSKGLDRLLEALTSLPGDGWRLRVAGRGDAACEAELRDRFPDPRIEWLGWTPPSDAYDRIDAVVVPSVWDEPMPRVVLEAVARRLPVVASSRGGTPELVEHGRNGLLYDPDRPEKLRAILARVIDNPGELTRLSAACAETDLRRTSAQLAEDYLETYRAERSLAG